MIKVCKWVLFVTICIFVGVKPAYAIETKFSVDSDITYKVYETGVTTVTQNFRLTNKTSDYNPAEFSYILPFAQVANIRAFDKTGALTITSDRTNDYTQIKFKFGDLVVGINKTLYWTVAYETSSVATLDGRFWKVVIPVPKNEDFESTYTIGLYIPKSFGGDKSEFIWTKSNLQSMQEIKLSFYPHGNEKTYQNFNFDLTYPLSNGNFYPVTTEITLPSDSSTQKVIITQLTPKPIDVSLSKDKQWVAKYLLGPASKLDVHVSGYIALFDRPFDMPLLGDVMKFSTPKNQTSNIKLLTAAAAVDYEQNAKLSVQSDIHKNMLYVENLGPTSYSGGEVMLSSQNNTIGLQTITIPQLPPYANRKFELPIKGYDPFTRHDDIITISFEGQSWQTPLEIRPIYENKFWLITGILFTLGIISLIAQIVRGLFLPKRRGDNHLHRESKKPV